MIRAGLNPPCLYSWQDQIFPPEEFRRITIVGSHIERALRYQGISSLNQLPQLGALRETRDNIIRRMKPHPLKMAVSGPGERFTIVTRRAYRRNHVPHVYELT